MPTKLENLKNQLADVERCHAGRVDFYRQQHIYSTSELYAHLADKYLASVAAYRAAKSAKSAVAVQPAPTPATNDVCDPAIDPVPSKPAPAPAVEGDEADRAAAEFYQEDWGFGTFTAPKWHGYRVEYYHAFIDHRPRMIRTAVAALLRTFAAKREAEKDRTFVAEREKYMADIYEANKKVLEAVEARGRDKGLEEAMNVADAGAWSLISARISALRASGKGESK